MLDTVAMVRLSLGIEFEFVNVGGGLGVAYQEGEPTVDVEQLAAQMRKVFDEKLEEHKMPEPHLHMENGRYMTGPYGWLVARCHVIKESHGKTYYGLDASMANLMRPGMYNSYHHITVPKREQPEVIFSTSFFLSSAVCNKNNQNRRNGIQPTLLEPFVKTTIGLQNTEIFQRPKLEICLSSTIPERTDIPWVSTTMVFCICNP